MGFWDTMGDIGLGVATGGLGTVVKMGLDGEGPMSGLSGKPTSHADPYAVNGNDYEYGGYAGDADAAAARYQAQQDNALAQSGDLQRQAQGLQGNQGSDRNAQVDAMYLQQQAAYGAAPSRAELLARAQGDRAMSAQTAAAASARTPAGIAMAQQQAAGNMARAQTDITNNTSALRADEMANARQAYAGQTNALRGSDQANQALLQQGALGYQQGAQGWATQEGNVRGQQLQGSIARDQAKQGAYNTAQGYNVAAQDKAADRKQASTTGLLSAGASVAGMASDQGVKNYLPGMQSSGGVKNLVGGDAGGTMSDIGGTLQQFGPIMPGTYNMGNSPQILSTAIPGLMSMLSDERTKNLSTIPKVEQDAAEKAYSQVADPSRAPTGSGVVGLGTMARLDALRHGVDPDAGYTGAVPPPDPALAKGMEEHLQATRPAAYTYKEGYGTPGVHVGPPSAQQMAKNPVGATMVAKDKRGTLAIDPAKAIKTTMGATAYVNDKVKTQQQQIDALEAMIQSRNAGYAKSEPATAGALSRVRGGQ